MRQLQALHEEFIEKARRPMSFGKLPINAKEVELPVVPMNRWDKKGDSKALSKTYKFRRKNDRNVFLRELFDYEEEEGHHSEMRITEDSVEISVYTKDIDKVTEIDREYAKFADGVYKEIVMMSNEL